MRACILDEWGGSLTVESVPTPSPGPNEVRVAVRACGVTRTIENAIQGGLDDDPGLTPRIPGHEFAGVVDEVGDFVDTVEPGDRVVAYFYLSCERCDACRSGNTNQCHNFGGWYGVNRDGAYAEQAIVPAPNVLPLAADASFAEGAIATDGLATPLHICHRTDIDESDTVLVIGAAGRIGIHLCQLAAARGAQVLGADIGDDRLAHIERYTEDSVTAVDAGDDEFADVLGAETLYNDEPTVVVDVVGDLDTLDTAWSALGMGGQLVTLTTHHDRQFAPLLKEFVVTEGSIVGSRYATKSEVVRAGQLFASGRIDPVVTDRVGLDEVPAVHERIRDGESHGMVILEP